MTFRAQLPGARVVGDNVHARNARAVKVYKLVKALDAAALLCGLDPFRNAIEIAKQVRQLDAKGWAEVAERAECKPPSDPSPRGLTVRAVLGEYLARNASRSRRAS